MKCVRHDCGRFFNPEDESTLTPCDKAVRKRCPLRRQPEPESLQLLKLYWRMFSTLTPAMGFDQHDAEMVARAAVATQRLEQEDTNTWCVYK
jgi:hypothetical protein